ncbi:MAG TPA: hypothetical protein VGN96_06475 [Roseococcus sp.]|jgi:hypothetical protein|nr:hypothetical protein [Roseococcus sp.]
MHDVPDEPQMPPDVRAFLEDRLKAATCYLEYGTGGSTLLALRLGVAQVYSVESDRPFAERVQRAAAKARRPGSNFWLMLAHVGETAEWGRPANTQACRQWPGYPLQIWYEIERRGHAPDLILIDGRFRVACFLACLLKARPGALIMFDDYMARAQDYHVVERHLAPALTIDRCAVFSVPDSVPAAAIALDLARHVVRPE